MLKRPMKIEDELNRIVYFLVNTMPIDEIYLFGSWVYGSPKDDSDFDIFVVLPDDAPHQLDSIQKLRCSLPRNHRAVDLLASHKKEFMERINMLGAIEREVCLKGEKIYDRHSGDTKMA